MTPATQVSPRLFATPLFESLSRVRPWMPIAIWGPVIIGLFYWSKFSPIGVGERLIAITTGLLAWSLTEYGLHRFVFHYSASGKRIQHFVFLMHGVHHEFPNDPDRLMMPPLAALLFATVFAVLFFPFTGPLYFSSFFGAFLTGYLCYDYTHFAIHHSERFGVLFPKQKRRHMIHHFVSPDAAYGVSSPLWDWVFGTLGK